MPVKMSLQALGRPKGLFAWFDVAVGLGWAMIFVLWANAYLIFTVDDSFYYLGVARNIATGYGPTFDQIHPTDGFHPLWMPMFAALALVVQDTAMLMRLAMLTQVAIVLASLLLVRKSSHPAAKFAPLVIGVMLLHPYVGKALLNGQESAVLYALLLASTFYAVRAMRARTYRAMAVLGVLGGLTCLARLDAVFFLAGLTLLPLLWPSETPWALGRRFLSSLVMGIVAVAVTAPYLLWNKLTFGHWEPVSGAVKASLFPVVFGTGLRVAIVAVCLAVLAATVLAARRPKARTLPLLLPAIFYAVLQTIYYWGGEGRPITNIWYYIPHIIVLQLAASAAIERRWGGRKLAYAVSILFALSCLGGWAYRVWPPSYAAYLARRDMGQWVRQNTPPDSLLAGWDCGIMGTHCGRRLMPLDGLINSWQYKTDVLDKHRIEEYITREQPVNYLAQHVQGFKGKTVQQACMVKGIDLSQWRVHYYRVCAVQSLLMPRDPTTIILLVAPPCDSPLPTLRQVMQKVLAE